LLTYALVRFTLTKEEKRMSKQPERVPVSMRALVQRINRKLAADGELLKKARSEATRQEAGDYFIIDVNRNMLMAKYVDPEALGRELGVLKQWERVFEN
jgi:hypothetical protein